MFGVARDFAAPMLPTMDSSRRRTLTACPPRRPTTLSVCRRTLGDILHVYPCLWCARQSNDICGF